MVLYVSEIDRDKTRTLNAIIGQPYSPIETIVLSGPFVSTISFEFNIVSCKIDTLPSIFAQSCPLSNSITFLYPELFDE